MTETITAPNDDPPTTRYQRRRSPLGAVVAARVQQLQRLSLADQPSAVRALAVLRRAVGTQPGSVPDAWQDTIGLLPDDLLGGSDEPSAAELAVHHSMTLFALHRQGRAKQAHVNGGTPGNAFARISLRRSSGGEDEGVRRRFDALVTATTAAEAAYHLRGLIMLARAEDVGFDYGYLADDLADLWTPRRRDRARLRWARQYRGMHTTAQDDGLNSAAKNPIDPTPEEQQ